MDIQPIITYASDQHDVVAEWELLELGLDEPAIVAATCSGELRPIPGLPTPVYTVGDARLTWHGRCMAASLAHPGVVISHFTALMLHGVIPIDETRPIDVTVAEDPAEAARLRCDTIMQRRAERFALAATLEPTGAGGAPDPRA